jgi:antitoxin component of RelBE/YafQ-DinJ toxin-antitoxin module
MFIKGVINYNGIPFNVIAPSEKVAENAKEYTPNNTVRPSFEYGSMFGKIWMADDFDAPLDD